MTIYVPTIYVGMYMYNFIIKTMGRAGAFKNSKGQWKKNTLRRD